MGDDFLHYLPDAALSPSQRQRLPRPFRLHPAHGFWGEIVEEFPPPAGDAPSMSELEWQAFCNPEPRPPIVGYDGCDVPGAMRWDGTAYVRCLTAAELAGTTLSGPGNLKKGE